MAKPESYFEPNPYLLRAMAHVLKKLRLDHGLTQEGLANLGNVHWRYVQEIEAGAKESPEKLKNISVGMFFTLSQALNQKPSDIMKLVEQKQHELINLESKN